MRKIRPAYVYPKGKKRHLYFVRGNQCIRIQSELGSTEFAAEYARLLRGPIAPSKRTIKSLIASYLQSERWRTLAKNTQRSYMRHFAYFEDVMPGTDPAALRKYHINAMRDALHETPTDANRKVSALSVLLEHGRDLGWVRENEARGVKPMRGLRPAREPWPEQMLAAFRANATGRALLLFEILLGTGQRIGDVLAMRWDDIDSGAIRVDQSKTGVRLYIPFTSQLRASLENAPRLGPYLVSQANGRPLSYQLAWKEIMDVRKTIGAEAHDIHSLRHTTASELAELGLSDQLIMSITGHSSSEMVKLYAGRAAQKARAIAAQNARGPKGESGNES